MRALRTLLISAVLAVGLAAPAAAQTTTTTMPPVRSIPVTPAPGVTTTTAPRTTTTTAAVSGETASSPLADTGLAADKLVPFGLLLISLGAVLTGASRRYGRPRYTFL